MQIFKRTEPQVNESDQSAANLAQQRKDLAAIGGARERLKAGAQATTAAQERVHAALSRIISDPMTFATTPAAELEAAKQALVASSKATTQAAAALAAHEAEHGDLAARGKQLLQEEHFLEQARNRAADQDDAATLVDLGSKLAAVHARMESRRRDAVRRWPEAEVLSDGRVIEKFGGLVNIGFPDGIFQLAPQSGHSGENLAVRTVWDHHVLRSVAERYPDVLIAALGDEGSSIVATVQADIAAKKPRWRARGVTSWDILPR
jgi:hypothetical protein